MNNQYFEVELTQEEAEDAVFALPRYYTFFSTEMTKYKKREIKNDHNEIMFQKQYFKLQQKQPLKLCTEENLLVNKTLMVLEPEEWRFEILEQILDKYQQDQEIIGIEEIKLKVLKGKYKTINSFLSDLHCLTNNCKLKTIDNGYKEQASMINKKLQKLMEYCNDKLYVKHEKDDSSSSQYSNHSKEIFTAEELRELESNLHHLKSKYLYGIRSIVGKQGIKEKKGSQSEELNLLKLSIDQQKQLLAYSRKCLIEQEKDIKITKVKLQQEEEDQFSDSVSASK